MSLIIGLTGEKGSGKGTFLEFLKTCTPNKKIVKIASSDILKETLKLWDIEQNRRNLQDMALVMDNHFGKGTLTHAVQKRIEATKADIIIFDGIRWKSDVAMIRSFSNNLLIYVTADTKVRYERTKARSEKPDEAEASFEKFTEEEKVGTEIDIPAIGKSADATIDNNTSLEAYKKSVEEIFKNYINKNV